MAISADQLQAFIDSLVGLRLDPLTFARVFLAIGPSLLDDEPAKQPQRVGAASAGSRKKQKTLPNLARRGNGAETPKTRGRDGKFVAGSGKGRIKWAHNGPRNVDRTETAAALLREALSAGPRPASDIDELAERRRISPNALGRAKTELGITAKRMDRGAGHIVYLFAPAVSSHALSGRRRWRAHGPTC
jgi:hypothetical protein